MRLAKFIRFSGIGIAAVGKSAFSRGSAKKYLLESLLQQPGLPAKIAQLISMRTGLDLHHAKSPQLSIEEIKARISEDSPALAAEMESLSDAPKVASLSQVHEGRLKSGQRVAIKVQFPRLSGELAEQVDDFVNLAARSPAKIYGFTQDSWGKFLKEKLLEETDYRCEARYQNEFSKSFHGTGIIVPQVIDKLSTKNILVQSWEESVPPGDLQAWRSSVGQGSLETAADLMVQLLARSLFQANLIHCDLNPGNYGFRFDRAREKTELVLYDFGAMQRLSQEKVKLIARLIARASDHVDDNWGDLLQALGFDEEKLRPVSAQLQKIMPALLLPFCQGSNGHPAKWNPATWNPGQVMDEILGAEKWWFRTAGPPWFLYLMRTIQGWHHGMKLIGEPVETWRIFREMMPPALAPALNSALAPGLPTGLVRKREDRMSDQIASPLLSKHLRVNVTEGQDTVVSLELPAAAIENLPDLVPDDVAQKILAQGMNLRQIADEILARRAPQGPVFEMNQGTRHYRVWLD